MCLIQALKLTNGGLVLERMNEDNNEEHTGRNGDVRPAGYVFHDFCLKQGIEFIIFCLNQGIDLSIFVLNRISFLDRAVNSFVIANGLNKKEFRYLLLSYTGYGFGLNVLNRVSKIGILS